MERLWRFELLGGLRLIQGTQIITRCRTQQAATLLARLALYPARNHSREELVEMLWPGSEPEAGRNNFKQRLATLRRQLEPPGIPFGGVILADRLYVRLNPDSITTDVAEFEQAVSLASGTEDTAEQVRHLESAAQLYRGELLPGFYEDWILHERTRLAEAHLSALSALTQALQRLGQLERALDFAQRALASDPLREESYANVMRLQVVLGNPTAAQRQYRKLEQTLQEELGETPSPALRRLFAELMQQPRALEKPTFAVVSSPAPPAASSPSSPSPGATPQPAASFTPRLPVQVTPFFGRVAELARLTEWLQPPGGPQTSSHSQNAAGSATAPSCLVTLTGIGGTGKTRLAIETARRLAADYNGAVWFVPLVEVTTADRIADALANALPLSRSPRASALEQAVEFLRTQPSLLVLDNMEQVTKAGAPVVRELLERTPGLALLVTSRHLLNLAGERELPLLPLAVPTTPDTPEALMEYESVQVFVNRAQAVRPDFQVTPRNAETLTQLCQRLEGIPLALELAASRSRVLTPSQMLTQLEKRLDFLVSRRHDIAERHRTLRATIEWSYRLLPPELQPFFTRLSVFRGGWSLEAAEAVCDEPNALDYLEQLREHSMIQTEEVGEGIRFRMLETLREFAEEQRYSMLKTIQEVAQEILSDADRAEISRRHAAFFQTLADQASPCLNGPDAALWCARLKTEYDNLRAALDFSLQSPEEGEATMEFAANLQQFWWLCGPLNDGRNYLESALARADTQSPSKNRAHALNGVAVIAFMQSDLAEAKRYYEQSLAIRRALNDVAGISAVLSNLGTLVRAQGEYAQAKTLYEEALALERQHGDRRLEAISLLNLGNVAIAQGEYEQARACYEECLAIQEEVQDQKTLAMCLSNLSAVAIATKEYRVALAYSERSLSIQRSLGNQQGVILTLSHLGGLLAELGEIASGKVAFVECLTLCRSVGQKALTLGSLESYAVSPCRKDRPQTMVRLLSATAASRKSSGFSLSANSRSAIENTCAEFQKELGEPTYSTLWEEGSRLTLEDALGLALQGS